MKLPYSPDVVAHLIKQKISTIDLLDLIIKTFIQLVLHKIGMQFVDEVVIFNFLMISLKIMRTINMREMKMMMMLVMKKKMMMMMKMKMMNYTILIMMQNQIMMFHNLQCKFIKSRKVNFNVKKICPNQSNQLLIDMIPGLSLISFKIQPFSSSNSHKNKKIKIDHQHLKKKLRNKHTTLILCSHIHLVSVNKIIIHKMEMNNRDYHYS